MKTDTFTKIVLTVIAVNLSILTVKNLDIIPKANANEPVTETVTCSEPLITELVPLNEDGTISVKLSAQDDIEVKIVGINTSDELAVNIDEIDGSSVHYSTPLPVVIKEK